VTEPFAVRIDAEVDLVLKDENREKRDRDLKQRGPRPEAKATRDFRQNVLIVSITPWCPLRVPSGAHSGGTVEAHFL
jgi:hypothetical protein